MPDRRSSAPPSRRSASPAADRRYRPGHREGAATSSAGRRSRRRRSGHRRQPARPMPRNRRSSRSCPPVSAISGTIGPGRRASSRLISRAVSVDPVKATPATRDRRPRARRPPRRSPGSRCSASPGMPASCNSRTAAAAVSGVCSAGLATTALPAASAAAIWPVKIASGKFHGADAGKDATSMER